MHNIAEGFDSESNAEFIRFLRYAKWSCTGVQSELYVALDEEYISPNEFKDVYEQARRTRAVRGFINYLKKYEEDRKANNREPDNLSSYSYFRIDIPKIVLHALVMS